MTQMHDYTVVLASAGTGKTFQLSNRFLRVLARDPSIDPAKLLATTFTRKAAGEILDRVLQRLTGAAMSEKSAAELDGFLGAKLGREGYEQLSVRVAGSLHRLCIQTIDAFTARVVGALGLELGLPPGWRIAEEDEDRALRMEAVDAALREADRDEMFALLTMWHAGGFGRSAHATLMEIVGDLYEAYLLTRGRPDAWATLKPSSMLEAAPLGAAIAALKSADTNSAGTGKPSKAIAGAVVKVVEAAQSGDWKGLLGLTIVRNVQSGNETLLRAPLHETVVNGVRVLARHAAGATVSELLARNRAAFSLMERFDAEYMKLKARRGMYRFDDLPRHVVSRPVDELLTRLYFRLDARVQHLLFDEFQDTSVLQFRLLEPMCDELLSQDDGTRSFLCVGDTKQSLYGWRGAKSQLLANLSTRWSTLHEYKLAKSFRSSQLVLDAVNDVFAALPSNRALGASDAGRMVSAEWARGYEPHRASKQNLKGHVRLWSPAVDDEEGDPCITGAAARTVEILEREPRATVGILVRSNRAIPAIIYELAKLGIAASEEGSSLLTDASPVAAIASLFHLADHPDDSASLFHVAHSPLAGVLGLDEGAADVRTGRPGAARRVSTMLRRRLADHGYQRTCEWLLSSIAPSVDERSFRRLEQMVDLAVVFDRRRAPSAGEFGALLRSRAVEDPVARQVRVMTIHKSKGLEFDAVILPELHPRRGMQLSSVFTDTVGEDGVRSPFAPVSDVSINPGEDVCAASEQLGGLRTHTLAARISEELSVLYVAMTRAVHSLDMMVPSCKKESESLSAAEVLCAAFNVTRVNSAGTVLYESGDAAWKVADETVEHGERAREVRGVALRQQSVLPALRWVRRSPSSLEGGSERTLESVLKIEPSHGLERGTLIHAFCERVGWLDESGPPRAEELAAVASALGWTAEESRPHITGFLRTLNGPLAAVLSRARYAGRAGLAVRREWSFAAPAVQGDEPVMLTGQIDRLVTWTDGGRVVGAEVLDFKTDAVSPERGEEFAARVEHYRPQLTAYRAAVAKMFGLAREAVRGGLVFLEAGVEVEGESEKRKVKSENEELRSGRDRPFGI